MATDPGSIVKEQPAQVQALPRTMSLQNGIYEESFIQPCPSTMDIMRKVLFDLNAYLLLGRCRWAMRRRGWGGGRGGASAPPGSPWPRCLVVKSSRASEVISTSSTEMVSSTSQAASVGLRVVGAVQAAQHRGRGEGEVVACNGGEGINICISEILNYLFSADLQCRREGLSPAAP